MPEQPLLTRWLRLNAVGLAGMGVQLGCLGLLVHGAGMHYLPASLLAVEAAVVHNFAWHQRWTWKDRPLPDGRGLAARFWRFQALNGAISLLVNSGAMIALAGAAGLDPVVAGLIAIVAASFANFAASHALVFGRAAGSVAVALTVLASSSALANGPDGPTVDAWRRHQAAVDARYWSAPADRAPFFVQDVVPGSSDWRRTVVTGGISMRQLDVPDVDGARIHHWAGAVYIPKATVAQVVERLKANAGREAALYEDVVDSRLLARDGDRLRVFMRLRRTTVLTATFDTEHEVEYRRIGPARASSRSVAVRIAELAEAGTPRERERGASEDRGFLWRLNAYWRFEQDGDGVIVECESVSLSRSVPALLRPVAGPIITRVARESLERTLRELRAAQSRPATHANR
jgi:putative flippase GtrA